MSTDTMTTRRAVIAAGAAAIPLASAAALPTASLAPSGGSPIARLWPEHQRLVAQFNEVVATTEGDEPMRLALEELWRVQDRIMSLPANTLQDLAIKAAVVHHERRGEEDLDTIPPTHMLRLIEDVIGFAAVQS